MTKPNLAGAAPAPSVGDGEKNEILLSELARGNGVPVFWIQKILRGRRDPIDWCLDVIAKKTGTAPVSTEPCDLTPARPEWLEGALVIVGTIAFVAALCLFK